jgi:hypothetical protein
MSHSPWLDNLPACASALFRYSLGVQPTHFLKVRSLEETMITAYDAIRETKLKTPGVTDLRTAAFVNAINKVAVSYLELGIFP